MRASNTPAPGISPQRRKTNRWGSGEHLFLTRWTIKRAAVSQGNSFDRAGTDAAVFAIPVVDPQVILKLAVFVIRVSIIGKRSAAPADCFMQHGGDHFGDS